MSFILELETPPLDDEVASRLEQATEGPDYLPLRAHRHRGWRRANRTEVRLWDHRDDVYVLSDEADWSQEAFTLDARGGKLLAHTVSLLSHELGSGWALRACWAGDDCEEERAVTVDELVELIRGSALRRVIRYRVT